MLAVRAPVDAEPLVSSGPLHPSEAVQNVASVELHVNVELVPLATVAGLADNATVGAGSTTETVTACEDEPPEPVQVSV